MFKKLVMACAGLVAATAVQAQALEVQWDWKRAHKCSTSSPQIKVAGIPDGTKLLRVKLVDNDVPTYNHGGGEVPNDGSGVIAEGALKSYNGPCPPNFGSFGHDYTFTVTALGEDGKERAVGTGTKNFSAKSVPQ